MPIRHSTIARGLSADVRVLSNPAGGSTRRVSHASEGRGAGGHFESYAPGGGPVRGRRGGSGGVGRYAPAVLPSLIHSQGAQVILSPDEDVIERVGEAPIRVAPYHTVWKNLDTPENTALRLTHFLGQFIRGRSDPAHPLPASPLAVTLTSRASDIAAALRAEGEPINSADVTIERVLDKHREVQANLERALNIRLGHGWRIFGEARGAVEKGVKSFFFPLPDHLARTLTAVSAFKVIQGELQARGHRAGAMIQSSEVQSSEVQSSEVQLAGKARHELVFFPVPQEVLSG